MTSLTPSTSRRRPEHARRRLIARWTKRIGLGALALGIAGGLVYAWMPRPVAVDVAVARRAPLETEVAEDGQTRVHDRFVVSAPISGELRRIELEAGAVVGAGDTLGNIAPPRAVLLDPRSRREATARLTVAIARQRTSRTAIDRAVVARDAAVRDADRARILSDRSAITRTERERYELTEQLAIRDLAATRLEATAATAEIEAARAALDDSRADGSAREVAIVAPAAGQVLRVLRDSEGPIAAGTQLLELGDPRAIEVVVDVLSSDAAQIRPGMVVSFERWGGDPLTGRVRRIEPSAFTRISALGVEEQRVKVISSVDAPPPALGDGFRVSARIITWHADDVLSIPTSAVFRDHGRWAVYAVVDGRAVLRPVTLGHRGRLDVELRDGLAAGDPVDHPPRRRHRTRHARRGALTRSRHPPKRRRSCVRPDQRAVHPCAVARGRPGLPRRRRRTRDVLPAPGLVRSLLLGHAMTTIFEVLHAHHREVEELFGDVEHAIAAGHLELARTVFHLVAVKVVSGMGAEHAVVYPRFVHEARLTDEVAQSLREHEAIERMVNLLRVGGLETEEWCDGVSELGRIIATHMDQEECVLFPMACLSLTIDELREIGTDYAEQAMRGAAIAGASITYDPPASEPAMVGSFSLG